jgi:hypothetical protein
MLILLGLNAFFVLTYYFTIEFGLIHDVPLLFFLNGLWKMFYS